jgi:phage repressor protein C with HTH and peptisase S24 domain
VPVRRVGIKASAGVAGYGVEDIEDGTPIFFRKDWCENNNYKAEKLLAMRVFGESMVPSLWPDDLVVINTAQTAPKDGAVFAIVYEGVVTVKRMQRDAGQLIGEVACKQSDRI